MYAAEVELYERRLLLHRSLLHKVPNVQVSDTTGDAICSNARLKKYLYLFYGSLLFKFKRTKFLRIVKTVSC